MEGVRWQLCKKGCQEENPSYTAAIPWDRQGACHVSDAAVKMTSTLESYSQRRSSLKTRNWGCWRWE